MTQRATRGGIRVGRGEAGDVAGGRAVVRGSGQYRPAGEHTQHGGGSQAGLGQTAARRVDRLLEVFLIAFVFHGTPVGS